MYNFYVRIADDGRRMKADDRPLMFRSSVLLHVAFLLAQYQPTQLAGSMRAGTALHELVVHVAAPSTFDFYGNEHAAAPDGSEARPFRSLHAARDALRAGLGAGRPRTVLVHGDHFLETPLQLDSRDSGSLDAPITYRSGSALKPARISGGRKLPISSFKPAIVPSGATGVVKTNLFALGLNASDVVGMEPALQPGNYPVNSLELFVDGEPMLRARSPNVAPDGTWLWAGYENVTSVSNMSVTLADTTLGALWAKAAAVGELYLHGYFQWDYRDDYLKVDSIVPVAGGTSFNITRDYYTVPQYPFTKGCRFYALNSLELLDQPGEYYLDPRSGDLYVLPERPFTDDSDVVVSVLRNVIDAKAVSYHVWKDLVISDARGSPLVIEGGGRNNIIVGNTVSNSGLFCIAVAGSNNIVRNNTVFGCGQGGISLFAGLPLSALDRGNSSIYGNHISNFSRICRTYTPGVTTSGVGNYIGYNTMKNSPHTMITAGAVDTVFEYNHLEHACFETSDASAFYVGRSWNQRGNIFRFNTIINVRATEKLGLVAAAAPCCQQVGIYLDDEMSGYEVYGNTLRKVSLGVLIGGGRRNKVYSNHFEDCDFDIHMDNRGMSPATKRCHANCTGTDCFKTELEALHYQQPPWSTRFPELVHIFQDYPCVPVYNNITNNTYCHKHSLNKTGPLGFTNVNQDQLEEWRSSMTNNRRDCKTDDRASSQPKRIPDAGLRDHPLATASPVVYLDGPDWSFRPTSNSAARSQHEPGLRATVPGDIISDLKDVGRVGDPWTGTNWIDNATAWGATGYEYTSPPFSSPKVSDSDEVLLVLDGIKLPARIRVNGHTIGPLITNQFTRLELRVGALLWPGAGNTVAVRWPTGSNHSCGSAGRFMAATSYDWAPATNTKDCAGSNTLTYGIWKSIYLAVLPRTGVVLQYVAPRVYGDGSMRAAPKQFFVNITVHLVAGGAGARGKLIACGSWSTECNSTTALNLSAGAHVMHVGLHAAVPQIHLWWPNGMDPTTQTEDGAESSRVTPALYNLSVSFIPDGATVNVVTTQRRIGFRTVHLLTHPPNVSAADGPIDGSGTFTMMATVNSVPIYARGANFLPMENLEGRVRAASLRQLVFSASQARLNFLRIWGGGVYQYESFYAAADEAGVLLLHDLAYAQAGHNPCNSLQNDSCAVLPNQASQLDEIRHNARRLAHHPSIAIWTGCNECSRINPLIMETLVTEDSSRIIMPACPSTGWLSGVDGRTGLPNEKKLIARADKHPCEFGAAGCMHESHGPYSSPAPRLHGRAQLPPAWSDWDVNNDTGLPMLGRPVRYFGSDQAYDNAKYYNTIGEHSPGFFVTEAGTVVAASFESLAPTLPREQWSLHSPMLLATRDHQVGGVIGPFFGDVGVKALDGVGEAALKRQTYLSQLAQALMMKAQIEAWRSVNALGTFIWSLNEIWPSVGWGLLDYAGSEARLSDIASETGMILGGRWRPLLYMLRASAFADTMVACGLVVPYDHTPDDGPRVGINDGKTAFRCVLRNDRRGTLDGLVTVDAVHLTGRRVRVHSERVSMWSPGIAAQQFCIGASSDRVARRDAQPCSLAPILRAAGCATTGDDCVLLASVTRSGSTQPAMSNIILLAMPAHLDLPRNVTVNATITAANETDGTAVINVIASGGVALYVTLVAAANGRFSENSILVLPDAPTEVRFLPFLPPGDAEGAAKCVVQTLRETLRVEHMAAHLF